MADRTLTAQRLHEMLSYDSETGVFRWKIRPTNRIHVGDLAGGFTDRGYWLIKVDRRGYRAHQLAWLYVHGVWPTHEIDHINETKADNRLVNLRDATRTQNNRNLSKPNSTSSSGFRGVSRNKGGWIARIRVDGQSVYLGYFATAEEAAVAYREAKRRFHD